MFLPGGRIDLTEGKLGMCWGAPEPREDALEVQDLFLQFSSY